MVSVGVNVYYGKSLVDMGSGLLLKVTGCYGRK
jgi:hypothetical protein